MKYRIIIKEANGTTKAGAPEKTWNPLETEPVPEPTWSGASKFASESEGFNIEDAIAKQYGLKILKNISVGKTAFSNVYLAEPENIRLFGNQKEVVLKLSKNENEYLPYERINQIRRNMIKSKDSRDKQAANYLPFIYLAKKIDIAQYGSIIIMEKLKEVPAEIIERFSYSPWDNATTLIELLKDEEFIVKLFNTSFQKLPKTSALLNKNENWSEKTKSIKDKIVYDIITGKKTNFNISKKLLNELDDVVKFGFKTPTRSGRWDVKVYYKQMNDIDLAKKEIFRIIKIITYHFINGISSSPLTDILIKNFIEIVINELKTGVPVAPVSAYYPSKTNVDISTYETLGPATQNFEDALTRLEKYGLERKDLHGKNYLMRDNGQIVISDPGLFVIK